MNAFREVGVILTAIIGLAIVATLVSRNARTPEVTRAVFGGFGDAIRAATAPVTGSAGFGLGSSAF
jgi:hypothetical protein